MRRSLVLLVIASIALLQAPAAGATDEVPPEEDDPKGCTTADGEDDEQCGAQGRDHFGNPGHEPPKEACADVRSEAGSVVTRVRPQGPRHADGSLAFIPGVCVYLPPGYGDSGLRYPTLYLLHGGGGDQADWVSFGSVQKILDAAYAEDPANALIVVMPDGRSGQWYDYQDGSFLIETYVLDHVVPFVDERYRTIDARRGRAIAGLSNGGYGAVHLAAKAPDLFRAAGAMSANIGARSFGGLGTPVVEGGPAAQESGAHYYGSLPIELVPNLDPVDLTIDWGATCSSDVTTDACATWGFEQAFRADNQAFRDRLESEGYTGTYEYRESEGSHAWRWWTKWLAERHLPFFWPRLADPEPDRGKAEPSAIPDTFRFRSIRHDFDVFGYEVSVDRPVKEFLDLDDVTAGGFTVTGSGTATVVTAPRYRPMGEYTVAGATDDPTDVRADRAGRLRIEVDLGPGHTAEQYTPAARAREAESGYWTERKVQITPAVAGGAGDGFGSIAAGDGGAGGTDALVPSSGGLAAAPRALGDPAAAAAAEQAAAGADTAVGIQPASTSAREVGATLLLLLVAVIGVGAGLGGRRVLAPLAARPVTTNIVVAVSAAALGAGFGHILLGFDLDGGPLQVPGVLGAVVGVAGALIAYATIAVDAAAAPNLFARFGAIWRRPLLEGSEA